TFLSSKYGLCFSPAIAKNSSSVYTDSSGYLIFLNTSSSESKNSMILKTCGLYSLKADIPTQYPSANAATSPCSSQRGNVTKSQSNPASCASNNPVQSKPIKYIGSIAIV